MYIRKKSPTKHRFAKELAAKIQRKREMKAAALASQELPPRGTSLESWFIGPKAENMEVFKKLIMQAVESHRDYRLQYFPNDPASITGEMKNSENYRASLYGPQGLFPHFAEMLNELQGSAPFYSYRWQSHMNGDLTMAGMLGYIATLLYNPNNVAAEASPVTTEYEIAVGNDLCEMLGYTIPTQEEVQNGAISPWGHITCDGSVANLEAMWAARNVKYYAVSLAEALKSEPAFAPAKTLAVRLLNGQSRPLVDLDSWTLLNLRMDDVLVLPEQLKAMLGKTQGDTPANKAIDDLFDNVMNNYLLQKVGLLDFYRRFLGDTPAPAVVGPVSMHYSWPKGAAVLGIGAENLIGVHVDLDCRQRMDDLRAKLTLCLQEKRPVLQVVAVIGSTEESAVDPLADVLDLREEFRAKGLDFAVHADSAWGGYFASILREPKGPVLEYRNSTPALPMSDYVTAQYRALGHADSITIDPHKAGFLPYPAGALCYRNSALRNVVSFTAPVVYHGGVDVTVGVYGIEGSKPGAAAAGAYLSHRVLGMDRYGYGQLLGKSIFNSKRFYTAVLTMAQEDDPFIVVPFQRLPAEREGKPETEVREQYEFIKRTMGPERTNDEITGNPHVMELFRQLGSDHSIVPYIFNFKTESGALNEDIGLMYKLNEYVFKTLSLAPTHDELKEIPMIVTSSQFEAAAYGEEFMDSLKNRLGVKGDGPIEFIISTTTTPFLTDTETPEGIMLGTVIQALRETVLQGVEEVKKGASLLV